MKLKYATYLSDVGDCPPQDYRPVEASAFRWVHEHCDERDFLPVNLLKEPPPRILNDSDLMCAGYELSLFDNHQNATSKYLSIVGRLREHLKNSFLIEKGDCVAELLLNVSDGIAGAPSEQNYGHFTFHESAEAVLVSKVVAIRHIFN